MRRGVSSGSGMERARARCEMAAPAAIEIPTAAVAWTAGCVARTFEAHVDLGVHVLWVLHMLGHEGEELFPLDDPVPSLIHLTDSLLNLVSAEGGHAGRRRA